MANFSEVIASAPDYDAAEVKALEALGIKYTPLSLERTGMNPLSDLSYLMKLSSFLRQEEADVVFSYNIKPVIYASLAARFAGVDKIYALIPLLFYLCQIHQRRKNSTATNFLVILSLLKRV